MKLRSVASDVKWGLPFMVLGFDFGLLVHTWVGNVEFRVIAEIEQTGPFIFASNNQLSALFDEYSHHVHLSTPSGHMESGLLSSPCF